eukprot:11300283-Alexandrium_andersonii.AAC.1
MACLSCVTRRTPRRPKRQCEIRPRGMPLEQMPQRRAAELSPNKLRPDPGSARLLGAPSRERC